MEHHVGQINFPNSSSLFHIYLCLLVHNTMVIHLLERIAGYKMCYTFICEIASPTGVVQGTWDP